MGTKFVLVGAEGVAEMGDGVPGIRQATESEEAAFKTGLEELCKTQPGVTLRDYYVDNIGRPYWLMAVEDQAPEVARKKAEKYKRVMRLID